MNENGKLRSDPALRRYEDIRELIASTSEPTPLLRLRRTAPAGEIFLVAEAVNRVFDKHGNRKNKQRARLRYLVEEKGFEDFKELYTNELARLREENPPTPGLRELPHLAPPDPATVPKALRRTGTACCPYRNKVVSGESSLGRGERCWKPACYCCG